MTTRNDSYFEAEQNKGITSSPGTRRYSNVQTAFKKRYATGKSLTVSMYHRFIW